MQLSSRTKVEEAKEASQLAKRSQRKERKDLRKRKVGTSVR